MKASGSYESIIRGVSQQVAQNRAEGQHSEQVNMIADAVNGLTRRHGSQLRAEQALAGLSFSDFSLFQQDTDSYRTFEYASGGNDYVLLVRAAAAVSALPAIMAYNRTTNAFLTVSRNAIDATLDSLLTGGVSAITAVGKYLFLAGNTLVTNTSTDKWQAPANVDSTVAWIRGGAFSRTYTITATSLANVRTTFSYTTPSSSYQVPLNTSDILTSDPDYTKKVNDRVNAYNSAVTAWIGTSTAAVQPASIAQALRGEAEAAGLVGTTVQGSHIIFSGVKALTVDDGGDGSLIRGVADEIESVDKVSVIHKVGKVVKVRSRNASEAFYLIAIAKDKAVTSGYTEVTWIEGAGVEHKITGGILYGTAVGNVLHLASTATLLTALTPGPHPDHVVSTAGDNDSATRPFFFGRKITYLGTFQNRLLVGCGGVLAVSKTEDYLNFFRSTVLTLPGNDAFEMQAQGSEDDELRYSTLYDKDLVIFGTKRQYVISGRVTLTPTSANMAVMSQYQDVADSQPITAGGFIFYSKRGETYSSLHQVQPGQNVDSPESFLASSQIDSYLLGDSIELASLANPSILFMRTKGQRSSMYTFAYLDTPQGRKQDSWSRWDFNPALGIVVGQAIIPDGILALFLRKSGTGVALVVDFCPVRSGLSLRPYLDSQRPYSAVATGTGTIRLDSGEEFAAAFGSESVRKFTGTFLPTISTLLAAYPTEPGLYVGALQNCYVEPTNPYMKDGQGKVILSGRLTITSMLVAYKESTGFDWSINYRDQVDSIGSFNGRVLGDPVNLIGREPVTTGQKSIPIGRETRQYTLQIKARRWYPFNMTALEWTGQFFNRVQRF